MLKGFGKTFFRMRPFWKCDSLSNLTKLKYYTFKRNQILKKRLLLWISALQLRGYVTLETLKNVWEWSPQVIRLILLGNNFHRGIKTLTYEVIGLFVESMWTNCWWEINSAIDRQRWAIKLQEPLCSSAIWPQMTATILFTINKESHSINTWINQRFHAVYARAHSNKYALFDFCLK